MSLALGIDAGGTYTDAVLYDVDEDRLVAWAKAPTTPPTYVEGVAEALANLPEDLRRRASYVTLSTTLATNAIVEGRHAPAGLILIGYDAYESAAVNWRPKRTVPGRHTIRGEEVEPFDERAFRRALEDLRAEGIAGLAISGVLSVRNPAHELRAAELARQMVDLPVVCGHELGGMLNALVRAETAALNAGLIPLIHRFIAAVELVLADAGLKGVPCFMVAGDGSLMSTSVARMRPVETILSGPACSALGAARLAKVADALVVDVGGTTTDVAVLEGGRPLMAARGVSVGAWRTGVCSARVLTRGLGGDSMIVVRPKLSVSSRRVVPISWVGQRWPRVREELEQVRDILRSGDLLGGDWGLVNPTEAFFRLPGEPPVQVEPQERAILEALADGARTRRGLAEAIGYPYLSLLRVERLERWGLLQRAGLTPTDLWHLTGDYAPWDRPTARVAAELVALRLGMTTDALLAHVREEMTRKLVRQVVQAYLGAEVHGDECLDAEVFPCRLTRIVLGEVPTDGLRAELALKPPIVGVGAPAKLFLEPVTEKVGARLVVPEGAPVANAVGAAIGAVIVVRGALVRPQEDGSVLYYGPDARREFPNRLDAIHHAQEVLVPLVREELARRGASTATIRVSIAHRGAEVVDSPEPIWWETEVTARGIGGPAGAGTSAGGAHEVHVVEQWDPGLREAEAKRGG